MSENYNSIGDFLDDNTRLALIRTLFAEERNYIAIERTGLSEFRTGISLAVIAPSIATALPYIFSSYLITIYIEIIIYIILIALTIFGIYVSISSYRLLKRARTVQKKIRSREIEIVNEMELTKKYFKEILS
jgi:uncharacterized membrane protein YidH (DUF202 family)